MASNRPGRDPPAQPDTGWGLSAKGIYSSRPPNQNIRPGVPEESHRRGDATQKARGMGVMPGLQNVPAKPHNAPRLSDYKQPSSSEKGLESRSPRSYQSPTASGSAKLRSKHDHNVLRRKPSTITKHTALASSQAPRDEPVPSIHSSPSIEQRSFHLKLNDFDQNLRDDTRRVVPPSLTPPAKIIPELDRYRAVPDRGALESTASTTKLPHKLSTHDLPPPTPLTPGFSANTKYSEFSSNSGYSASPATRYSESPGLSIYSRDTTPTSMSSQSPGIMAQSRIVLQPQQASPLQTRPPTARRRNENAPGDCLTARVNGEGLPALRESVTSSSSNSTVKEGKKAEQVLKEKRRKKGLTPPPPSPPPRKSSHKFGTLSSTTGKSPQPRSSKSPALSAISTAAQQQSSLKSSAPILANNEGGRPPSRPSRDGAPDLLDELGLFPTVIQSNLPGLHFFHERGRSSSAGIQSSMNRSDTSLKLLRSPATDSSSDLGIRSHRQGTPVPAGLGIIPHPLPTDTTTVPRPANSTRTPSPHSSTSKPRFGFFGRRNRTAPATSQAEVKDQQSRKGPAAGTGHEGYGRYAPRGRTGSSPVLRDFNRGNSGSQESLTIKTANDTFLRERISPVIIAGGGEVIENQNSSLELLRSESNKSLGLHRQSTESKNSMSFASTDSGSDNVIGGTMTWVSGIARKSDSSQKNTTTSITSRRGRLGSDTSDSEVSRPRSILLNRRSVRQLSPVRGAHSKSPADIHVKNVSSSAAVTEAASLQVAGNHHGLAHSSLNKGSKTLPEKARLPRKWNIFQKSHTSSPKRQLEASLPALITKFPEKTVAHYALIDSSDQEETVDLEDILREAEVVDSPKVEDLGSDPKQEHDEGPTSKGQVTPRSEVLQLLSEPVVLETEATHMAAGIRDGRPSRLPQVGRIPRVTTARPEQTSPKSFSRPFARVSTIQPLAKKAVLDRQSIALGPSPERMPSLGDQADSVLNSEGHESLTSPEHQRAFLVISPRNNSVATTSSSSGVTSFAATTAIVPAADAALGEDEVWDEYNDLIGTEESIKEPRSATSSHGVPFQYEEYQSRAWPNTTDSAKAPRSNKDILELGKNDTGQQLSMSLSHSSPYSPGFAKKFKEALDAVPSPTTPLSFTDFISGYGDRNNSMVSLSTPPERKSSPETPERSNSQTRDAPFSSSNEATGISSQHSDSPIAHVNLRVGSMTVSKWLTFGHVLFSPVREEVQRAEVSRKQHSVLIIDGLGNGTFQLLSFSHC